MWKTKLLPLIINGFSANTQACVASIRVSFGPKLNTSIKQHNKMFNLSRQKNQGKQSDRCPPTSFFNWRSCWLCLYRKKKSLQRLCWQFWWMLDKNYLSYKLDRVSRSLIQKNLARQAFIFKFMFLVGYSNEFTVVWSQIICQLFLKTIQLIITFYTWSIDTWCLWHGMSLSIFS